MITVKLEHLRQLRYCSSGIRAFFAKHDLDYSAFLARGISAEELLEKTNNDYMAVRAVEVADGRRG